MPNVGIVITDGRSNNEEETWKEAMEARKDGIEMLAIGVGSSVREHELQAIATAPTKQNVVTVNNFDALSNIRQQIIDVVCRSES